MDEAACKKQKVTFQENTCPPGNDISSFRSNDIIELIFIESSQSTAATAYKPDFTHQLFENETVQLSVDPHKNPRITISVDCSDLSQAVSYPATLSKEDIDTLAAGIDKALPDECVGGFDDASISEVRTVDSQLVRFVPPGSLVHQFSVGTALYEIWLATAKDHGASELLHRAEKLAMWFIETADSVDFSDDRWETLFLYAVDNAPNEQQSPMRFFAGYMTLFSFRNPFRGTKLRVCQALVLPHRQGHGLGREMLLYVYKHIVQSRGDICELTVEDPAVGFQRLRDAVDLELFVAYRPDLFARVLPLDSLSDETAIDENPANTMVPPTEQDICSAMKIIKTQAQFLLECVEYVKLVQSLLVQKNHITATANAQDISTTTVATTSATKRPLQEDQDEQMKLLFKLLETSDAFKTFRLRVKRRILKNDKELSAIAPKSEMQKALTEEFALELKRFHALESTAKRLGLVSAKLDSLL